MKAGSLAMIQRQIGKQLLALGAMLLSPTLLGAAPSQPSFADRLLIAQNAARAAVGVAPMQWDARLAADARAWADHLGKTGQFAHSSDEPGAEPQGENLWAGTKGYYGPEAMVALWAAEKSDYKTGVFPDNSRSGDVERVGHYTQLIWTRTHAVGCAIARSQSEDVLVCRYSEAGNVTGERPV